MYAPFFGLQHPPFSIAPDPRYLFMSERHREALAHLLYGLDAGGGFVLLTGEVGAGKTTVCRCFLEQIPSHCDVAYIFNPKLTVGELLRSICDEFGVPHQPSVAGRDLLEEAAADGGLAGADLAGQQHEAAAALQPVQQVRQRLAVPRAQVQEARVGRDRERLLLQSEEGRIHGGAAA